MVSILFVSCKSNTERPNIFTKDYADNLMTKSYNTSVSAWVTAYGAESSATYLRLILEEEIRQTELLQQLVDKK